MRVHLLTAMLMAAPAAAFAQPDPAALYKTHCAQCHDKPERGPDPVAMKQMSSQAIFESLTTGKMAANAQALSSDQKRALSQFLGRAATMPAAAGDANMCPAAPLGDPMSGPRWSGWGLDLENSRFQKNPGLTAADIPKLTLKWAFAFPDVTAASAQPAIAAGRVFVGSTRGVVYSLDAKSGCTHWTFTAPGGVRTAISVGSVAGSGQARVGVFFGDYTATIHALDAATGKPLWSKRLDTHQAARITAAPVLHDGFLYAGVSSFEEGSGGRAGYECCTFRGSVAQLNASTGDVVWQTYTTAKPEPVKKTPTGTQLWGPSGVAVWTAPTIDVKRGVVFVGTGNAYSEPVAPMSDSILAIDMKSGKIRWSKQLTPKDVFVIGCGKPGNPNCPENVGPDFDFGSSPILRSLPGGRSILVVGQKSGVAYGLDPDRDGEILWQFRAGQGGPLGGIEWGMAADDENVYVPVSDVLLPVNAPRGLFALKIATGDKVWHAPHPELACTSGAGCVGAQSAAVTVVPGAVFSGSIDGHLRAYSTKDGQIIWSFNTARDFDTVNGVKGSGGSIDAAGPVVAGGMVFTNSGYGAWRGKAGNVLLAFEVAK